MIKRVIDKLYKCYVFEWDKLFEIKCEVVVKFL